MLRWNNVVPDIKSILFGLKISGPQVHHLKQSYVEYLETLKLKKMLQVMEIFRKYLQQDRGHHLEVVILKSK